MQSFQRVLGWVPVALALLMGCDSAMPTDGSYYDERIAPVFRQAGCTVQTAGCHLASAEGSAAGNLDMTSYDSLLRRRDVLAPYGPYPFGVLLLKGAEDVQVAVETLDPPDPSRPEQRFVTITTEINHAGGKNLRHGATGLSRLREWLDTGFDRYGAPSRNAEENAGECVPGAGVAPGFDPDVEPVPRSAYDRFVAEVQPVLVERCAGSACHGAALADLHLSCGEDEAGRRWNYFIAVQHLTDPVDRSELLLRPLSTNAGGAFHGGGNTFENGSDDDYQTLRQWAQALLDADPSAVRDDDVTEGFRFFVNRVQPTLVRKGCMQLNCHSPISLKLNLRGGSGGSFSRFARRINYRLARGLLALEAADPNQSRLVQKNLFPVHGVGLPHRGGSLLEDLGGPALGSMTPDACVGYDADAGDLNEVPAYCVVARWHEIERADAVARGEVLPADELVRAVVWVRRPVGAGAVDEFDTYLPGADLLRADATIDVTGSLALGTETSLLAGCGLDPASADVRGPAVSWDGTRIAFAARSSATEPLRLWWMDDTGAGCEPIGGIAAPVDAENGILTHDFDPAFGPDGTLVFASTRGNLDRSAYDYAGPTRTPAAMAPNANLYAFDDGNVRQLTFLLNQELAPAFMADGRVIFTLEKREPGFHQLALRRLNLDGGDFHPLMASRGSIGFSRATEVAHLPNLDFVFVGSMHGAPEGAGSIVFFSRSIGPDAVGVDAPAMLHAMRVPMPGVLGGSTGVFRSPAPLPTGRVLAACDPATVAMSGGFDFDLCEVDPVTGTVRVLGGVVGAAELEPVAIYARMNRGVLVSDGGGVDRPDIVAGQPDAVVHFNDFPVIASLMFENSRTGRPLDHRIAGFEVWETLPPPVGATTFDDVASMLVTDEIGPLFVARRRLGHVPLYEDGSAKMRLPGGTPVLFQMTDEAGDPLPFPDGAAFEGSMIQREQEQYYPGERIQRSIPRRFFNGVCGGCHGSLSGRELDIAVNLDVITGASINVARDEDPTDLFLAPADRGSVSN